MNIEELEKEAEEKFKIVNKDKDREHYYDRVWFKAGYLAGAEPREKRIVELEQKLEQTEKDLADYQFNYPTIKELTEGTCFAHLKSLEQENAELKEKINILENCDRLGDVITQAYKDQLAQAEELLAKWVELFKPKLEGYPITPIQEQTEQFLQEIEI